MTPKLRVALLKAGVWIAAGAPLAVGLYRWFFGDQLGANPLEVMILQTGLTAIILLIVGLGITPVRRITGWNSLQKVRRLVGLWAFAYAAGHVGVYLWLDQGLEWSYIIEDVTERPFIVVGTLTFLLLVPLAVTSTRGWIRRLGKNWTRLHWLVYPATVLGWLHYTWGQKADLRGPIVAAVLMFGFLGFRVWTRVKKARASAAAAAALVLVLTASACAPGASGMHGGVAPTGPAPAGGEEPVESAVMPPVEGTDFAFFRGDGTAASIQEFVAEAGEVEAVLFGEQHNDLTAHRLQAELLRRLFVEYQGGAMPAGHPGRDGVATPSTGGNRRVILTLEMFERDVQYVLDEYLSDVITESHLKASARPWNEYDEHYRPMVEFAKAHGVEVVAANAPRRYVNRVSRLGPESLDALSAQAREFLAPLPYPQGSAAYRGEWDALMGGAAGHGGGDPFYGQTLWDATMAHSIARALDGEASAADDPLVFHLAGSFHVKNFTGTPEALEHYRPGTRSLVLVAEPAEDLTRLPDEHRGAGDFVVLTRAAGSS